MIGTPLKYLIIIVLCIACCTVSTQAQYFNNHNPFFINAGSGVSNIGIPIYIGGEYGFRNNSYAFEFMYCPELYPDEIINASEAVCPDLTISYRYHLLTNTRKNKNAHDLYLGISAGFFVFQDRSSDKKSFVVGPHLGYRYYFEKKLAMNIEVGLRGPFLVSKIGMSYSPWRK